jgi:cobalt/nickel transport system permease protein
MAQGMKLPAWFREEKARPPYPTGAGGGMEGQSRGFVEKNLAAITAFMREVVASHEYSQREGMLQALDPRARIGGIMVLVVGVAFMEKGVALLTLLMLAAAIMYLSNVDAAGLVKRVMPPVVFTAILVVPVFFNFITPGTDIFGFNVSGFHIAFTSEGLQVGFRLIVRVTAMVSLVALLFLTTKEADLFKGLKGLPVPGFFITALFMTFRYILILLKIVEDTNLSKKSRTISKAAMKESQRWFAGRVAYLFERSLRLSEEVTQAMASRGFAGEVKTLEQYALKGRDYLWLGFTSFVFFLSLGV